jgi:hypothetical protein
VDRKEFSALSATCYLWRVRADHTRELVAEYPDFEEGWQAGQSAVHADPVNAYVLLTARGRSLARFAYSRVDVPGGDLSDVGALVSDYPEGSK